MFCSVYSLSQTTLYTGGYTSTTNSGGWVNSVITTIDITSYTDIAITVDFGEDGDLENQDSFDMQYQIDGSGPWSAFASASNDICDGVCGGSLSGGVSGLNGTTSISIRTRLRNGVDETWWFDNLIVTGIPDPLPVELLYFEAVVDETYVHLKWATASEINNDYFILQESIDGIIYKDIQFLSGAGNSTTIIEYSININKKDGDRYYKLKQVDFDGTTSYSDIIFILNKEISNIIIGIFDIHGRPVDMYYKGIIIIRYSDGSYKKIIKL